jgi:hypothetical protein
VEDLKEYPLRDPRLPYAHFIVKLGSEEDLRKILGL